MNTSCPDKRLSSGYSTSTLRLSPFLTELVKLLSQVAVAEYLADTEVADDGAGPLT
jgi:hypothetical protein